MLCQSRAGCPAPRPRLSLRMYWGDESDPSHARRAGARPFHANGNGLGNHQRILSNSGQRFQAHCLHTRALRNCSHIGNDRRLPYRFLSTLPPSAYVPHDRTWRACCASHVRQRHPLQVPSLTWPNCGHSARPSPAQRVGTRYTRQAIAARRGRSGGASGD